MIGLVEKWTVATHEPIFPIHISVTSFEPQFEPVHFYWFAGSII